MKIPHYDENNNIIDTDLYETTEQIDAKEYIRSHDVVLELGARYGTVSTIINNLLDNKKNHVVIEPDSTVLNALQKNRNNHNCEFEIFTGVITNKNNLKINQNGYGTYISEDSNNHEDIESITYQNFCKKYNLDFNTLVVDCEGCFGDVLDSIGDDITNFDKILIELDQPHLCNYENIDKQLSKHFYKIKSGFHSVYINKNNCFLFHKNTNIFNTLVFIILFIIFVFVCLLYLQMI